MVWFWYKPNHLTWSENSTKTWLHISFLMGLAQLIFLSNRPAKLQIFRSKLHHFRLLNLFILPIHSHSSLRRIRGSNQRISPNPLNPVSIFWRCSELTSQMPPRWVTTLSSGKSSSSLNSGHSSFGSFEYWPGTLFSNNISYYSR